MTTGSSGPGLLADTLKYLPVNLIQALSSIVMVVVFTRVLDPAGFGRYVLAMAAIQVGMGLGFYWLQGGSVRFYAAHGTGPDRARFSGTIWSAALAIGIVVGCAAVALGALPGLAAPWHLMLPLTGITMVVRAWAMICLELHRAAREPGWYSALECTQFIVSIALGTVLAARPDIAELGPLLAQIVGNLIILVVALPRLLARLGLARPSRAIAVEMWTYGQPLALAFALTLGLSVGDRFVIAWLLDEAAVGIYGVAASLAERPLAIIFAWIGMAVTPVLYQITHEHQGARAKEVATRTMAHNFELLTAVALPAAAGIMLLAGPIAAVMAGAAFSPHVAALMPWIALAALFQGLMAHYVAHPFHIMRRTRALLWTGLMLVPVSVGLNLLLIPLVGLPGVALAALIAALLAIAVRLRLARAMLPVPLPVQPVLRAAAATLAMACAVVVVQPGLAPLADLLLRIATGGVVYAVAAYALNVADLRVRLRPYLPRPRRSRPADR